MNLAELVAAVQKSFEERHTSMYAFLLICFMNFSKQWTQHARQEARHAHVEFPSSLECSATKFRIKRTSRKTPMMNAPNATVPRWNRMQIPNPLSAGIHGTFPCLGLGV